MTPLFTKLNLGAVRRVHVVDAPASFEAELAALTGVEIRRTLDAPLRFALAFVQTLVAVDAVASALITTAEGDAVIWMVYPKASSKRYRCEFNRDSGWQALGALGYEPVRQVAIDADWSALRFRKADAIRTMKRHPDGAISAAGRAKALRDRQHGD